MNQTSQTLEADEYLHIAMTSIREGNHQSALTSLKDGVAHYSEDPRLHFLLAAEYAQLDMFEQADRHFRSVLALAPEMHVARFQLGLLQLTNGLVEEARNVWQGLGKLPEDNALRLFKEGMEALAMGQLDEAKQQIQAGIAANQFSPELNRDMEGVLQRMAAAEQPLEAGQEPAQNQASGHVLLHAYQAKDH